MYQRGTGLYIYCTYGCTGVLNSGIVGFDPFCSFPWSVLDLNTITRIFLVILLDCELACYHESPIFLPDPTQAILLLNLSHEQIFGLIPK